MSIMRTTLGKTLLTSLLGCLLGACNQEATPHEPAGGGHATTNATHGLGQNGRGLLILNPEQSSRPYYHRLGVISYGQRREHTFTFQNHDPKPVTIQAIQPACACVRPISFGVTSPTAIQGVLSRHNSILTIPPGATADLVLRIDTDLVATAQQNRDKLVTVRMRCTSEATPFLMLEVSFKVDRLFSMGRDTIELGDIPMNGGGGSEVNILTGIPGSPAQVLAILSAPDKVQAKLETIHNLGELHWQLTAELDPPLALGPVQGEIVLSTTDSEGLGEEGRLTIPFRGTVVTDVVLSPTTLSFSLVPQGKEQRLEAVLRSLLPGQRLRVHSPILTGPSAEHMLCDLEAIGADDEGNSPYWKVGLVILSSHPAGRIEASLTVQTDDPNYPLFTRGLTGLVRGR
ncbi:MAG: DUF1573 domain-containing protein [Planctomycetota bacterium]|nr:DUF1573 domain-containing protein [Planctomycetota bacterium]